MVIFGMKQYHKDSPSKELVSKIVKIVKNASSIDICLDLPYKPNLEAIGNHFTLSPCITKSGYVTDTVYINDTLIPMLDSIVIYNKREKNNLDYTLWRIEATISIPSIKYLSLPLYEFKSIIDLAKIPYW